MKAPLNDGKFVGYGGPGEILDTEVRGDALTTDPGAFFIAPDSNYQHLCLIGNHTFPKPGEPADGPDVSQVVAAAAGRPIIKCELYAVGSRPDPTNGNPGTMMVTEGGRQRPLAVGDKVRVRGLYVVDYAHPWSNSVWTSSFVVMRGLLEAGYVHSELHPYEFGDVQLVSQLPAAEQAAESHTIVAPVCPEQYSSTYLANKFAGVAGDLVTNAMWTTMTATFELDGGPSPGPAYTRRLTIDSPEQIGAPPTISSEYSGTTGLTVTVRATGTDITNPSFYSATFGVSWVETLTVSWTPATVPVDTPVDLVFTAHDATGKVVPGCEILLNGAQVGTSGSTIRKTFQHRMVTVTESVKGADGKPHLVTLHEKAPPVVSVVAQHQGYEDAYAKLRFAQVAPF